MRISLDISSTLVHWRGGPSIDQPRTVTYPARALDGTSLGSSPPAKLLVSGSEAPDGMADEPLPPRSETPVSPLYSAFPLPASRVSSLQLQRLSNRSDGIDMTTMNSQGSRPQAMSPSPSTISSYSTNSALYHQPATPTNVYPPPAYVAGFGATQAVSERKRRFSDDEDEDDSTTAKPAREDLQFSVASLALLNGFLDQLLYSILLQARSTTLTALRPAVTEVLRSRLASEAIASAEEELSELLAGGEEEEEEMNQRQSVSERKRKWDTELVWKRTRLRVMVYIRLGEMEDDDEERYVREDELFQNGDHRFSSSAGLVSWAAAIFLTSVLEYVAEQLLQVAAQAADIRARRLSRTPRLTRSASDLVTPDDGDYLTVEEHDMDRIALHKTAGRLWRTWKKTLRSNAVVSPMSAPRANGFSSRGVSKEHINGTAMSPRWSSYGGGPESVDESRPTSRLVEDDRDVSDGIDEEIRYPEHILAANIPLPMENEERDIEEIQYPEHVLAAKIPLPMEAEKQDIDEIEVPGLARDPDAADELPPVEALKRRRSSWAGLVPLANISSDVHTVPTPDEAEQASADMTTSEAIVPVEVPHPVRKTLQRARSSSLPVLPTKPAPTSRRDEPTAAPDEATDVETHQPQPEQKANAAEMGALKRAAVPEDHTAIDDANDNLEPTDSTIQTTKRKSLSGTVAPVAVASAAAAAVAATAVGSAAYLSREETDEEKEQKIDSAVEKDNSSEPAAAMERTNEVDERDNHKTLKDLKRLSVPTGQNLKRRSMGQLAGGGEDVPRMAKRMSLTQAVLVRSASSKDITTRPWLGDDSHGDEIQAPAALQDVSTAANRSNGHHEVGVAKTSDTAMSTHTTGEPEEGLYHARDSFINPAPRRQSRIVLSDSPVSSPSSYKTSPLLQQQEDDDAAPILSPESFLKGRSLSAKNAPQTQKLGLDDSQSTHTQARSPAPKSPIRISAPDSLVIVNGPVSPISDRTPSPWRQSFSAAIKETTQWAPSSKKSSSVSESTGPVQDHPALQKMATRSQTSLKEPETSQPLTSASIRGPEDFEMFVQGGDTVKYTLTPESVRGDPVSSCDVVRKVAIRTNQLQSATEAVPYLKTVRSTEKIAPPSNKQSSVDDARVGRSQNSRQATAADAEAGAARSSTSSKDKRRSISRPPVRNTSVHRKSGLMAREPQVQTESTRDFADFIRSTGPDKEPELRPLLSNRSTTSLQALRDAHISGSSSRAQSPGPSRARSMSRSHIEAEDLPPVPAVVPPVPANNRIRSNMQPRGPVQTAEDGTSELIDFIRSGPTYADATGDERQHRISRSVAPFRTTMDSDQMNGWGERYTAQPDLKINTSLPNVNNEPSVRSAHSSHNSYRTSANSRSALLNHSASTTQEVAQPAYSEQPVRLTSVMPRSVQQAFPTPSDSLKKTRVRNKDPYAIDFDDDDDDDDLLTALPKGRQREQESLIDFLRNSEPPSPASARPASNGATSPTSMKRGNGSSGLKTFGADAVSFGRKGSQQSRDGPQSARSAQTALSNGTTTTASGPMSKPRSNFSTRDRDADYTGPGGTRDLADFFRGSAPPSASTDSIPRLAQRSGSKASTATSKASMTSSMKKSRMSFLGGGMSSIFGRNRKAMINT